MNNDGIDSMQPALGGKGEALPHRIELNLRDVK